MSGYPSDESPGYVLKRAQSAFRYAMDVALREVDLTTSQFALLTAVKSEKNGLSNAELARRCFVTAQAMHGVVVVLERRGLIERPEEPIVGRTRAARLTPEGRRVQSRASRIVDAIEARAFSALTAKERRQMVHALLDVVRRLEGER